ncbi:MAG: F0F1 ATP synthase subunit delta [Candidatus Omnitrophica bacterium]|nr:F0F1 ATP synthase subunit delta [Candidatus Omnitrophota bacterium]
MNPIQLILFQLLIFGALAVVLLRFLGRHATSATAHLQGLSQDYMKRQEEMKKRLEEAERHYRELLAKAQAEGTQLKTQAVQEAEEKRRQTVEEARTEAERIVNQAVQTREAMKREVESAVEKRAVQRACELLEEVLPKEMQESTHGRWMEEALGNGLLRLNQMEMPEKVKTQEARVVSAAPLTPAQKERLQKKLEQAMGHPVTLREEVDPRIIAGITITLGHMVLDGSLVSKLREAARRAEGKP